MTYLLRNSPSLLSLEEGASILREKRDKKNADLLLVKAVLAENLEASEEDLFRLMKEAKVPLNTARYAIRTR